MKVYFINRRVLYVTAFVSVITFALACNGSNNQESAESNAQTEGQAAGGSEDGGVAAVKHAEAAITATYADTTVSGTAKFDATDDGKVKLTLDISVPSKAGKSVAVHIHEHGDCGDNGNMSHGHWNPTNQQHGKWGSASFHSGDIGNVQLDAEGKGTLTMETDLWSLGGDEQKNILNRAVIVHGGVDDFTTQPTGNAGSRIGCGVIQ